MKVPYIPFPGYPSLYIRNDCSRNSGKRSSKKSDEGPNNAVVRSWGNWELF